jgi:hypothetical protein
MQDQKDGNFMYSGELQPSRFPALLHSLTLKVLQTIGKIKLLLITISFLLMLFSNSCFDEEPDCVCTLEFRTYLVTVIDTLGNPVDSLETTITNSRGKEFSFDELSPPPFMQGAYYVMTNGYENEFTIRPRKDFLQRNKRRDGSYRRIPL